MRVNTNRSFRVFFLAFVLMAFVIGFFYAMAIGPRIYVLGLTMLVMVIVYAVVELGWAGGTSE